MFINVKYIIVIINYECYIMIELTFLKVFMLIKQVNQKSVMFVTIGIFWIRVLNFKSMPAIGVMMY